MMAAILLAIVCVVAVGILVYDIHGDDDFPTGY